jgi:hypothetical protein
MRDFGIALLLVAVQVASGAIESVAYRLVLRPLLIGAGAQRCGQPVGDTVRDCDLLITTRRPSGVEQTFYSADGSLREQRTEVDGVVQRTSTTYLRNVAMLILPSVALFVAMIASVHKVIRTGAFFTWQLSRFPWDRFERTLLSYSLPVIAVAFVQLWLQNGPLRGG